MPTFPFPKHSGMIQFKPILLAALVTLCPWPEGFSLSVCVTGSCLRNSSQPMVNRSGRTNILFPCPLEWNIFDVWSMFPRGSLWAELQLSLVEPCSLKCSGLFLFLCVSRLHSSTTASWYHILLFKHITRTQILKFWRNTA